MKTLNKRIVTQKRPVVPNKTVHLMIFFCKIKLFSTLAWTKLKFTIEIEGKIQFCGIRFPNYDAVTILFMTGNERSFPVQGEW